MDACIHARGHEPAYARLGANCTAERNRQQKQHQRLADTRQPVGACRLGLGDYLPQCVQTVAEALCRQADEGSAGDTQRHRADLSQRCGGQCVTQAVPQQALQQFGKPQRADSADAHHGAHEECEHKQESDDACKRARAQRSIGGLHDAPADGLA